jgi:hypothetical protein
VIQKELFPMISALGEIHSRSLPFLLRFLSRLQPPACSIVYDRAEQLNMLAGQTIPAVYAGLDVKTITIVKGED